MDTGLPVAVASGGSRSHVIAGLKATGLLEQLDAVATCEVRLACCLHAMLVMHSQPSLGQSPCTTLADVER